MKLRAALLVALVTASCAAEPAPTSGDPRETASPLASASPASPPPLPTDGRPAIDAVALLGCEAGPSDVGGAGDGIATEGAGAADPDDALDSFLETTGFVIPRSGYEPLVRSGDQHAYGYVARGGVKVVIVVSTRFAELVGAPFSVEEVRTCPSPEFGENADFNDGRRTWTHVTTGAIITDIPGSAHCGWESARLMHVLRPDGDLRAQFVRDPEGVLPQQPLRAAYAADAQLPADASDSGYRSEEGWELWFSASGDAAYVVTSDATERWPRAAEPIGCA